MSATGCLRPRCLRSCGHCGSGQSGGVLLLVVVLLPVLLGFAGAAVDVRNGYVVRSMVEHSLDDGVLSAQRWSAQADDGSGDATAVMQGAVAEALSVARQELETDGLLEATTVTAAPTGAQLTMTAKTQVPTFFLGILGIPSWTIVARADAVLWGGQTADVSGGASGGPEAPDATSPAPGTSAGGSESTGELSSTPPATAGNDAGSGGSGGIGLETASAELGPSEESQTSTDATATADTPAACNCDAIAAGDPVSAAAALDRMGVTPADPGPYAGDLTAGLGLGEMQSQEQAGDPDASGATNDGTDQSDGGGDAGTGDSGGW